MLFRSLTADELAFYDALTKPQAIKDFYAVSYTHLRVGSVDRCSYVDKSHDGWMFSGRCLRVRPTELVDSQMCIRDRMQIDLDNPLCLDFIPRLELNGKTMLTSHGCSVAVSYTHLDVYKRQPSRQAA